MINYNWRDESENIRMKALFWEVLWKYLAEKNYLTCAINSLGSCCHDNAGDSSATPKLQHRARPERVPFKENVISQEEGSTPDLGTREALKTESVLKHIPWKSRYCKAQHVLVYQRLLRELPWCALWKWEQSRKWLSRNSSHQVPQWQVWN